MRAVLSLWKGEQIVRDSMRDVATAVAEAKGMTLAELRTPSRVRHISWARQEALDAIYAAGWSNAQAARFMGLADHTATVYARRAVAARALAQQAPA